MARKRVRGAPQSVRHYRIEPPAAYIEQLGPPSQYGHKQGAGKLDTWDEQYLFDPIGDVLEIHRINGSYMVKRPRRPEEAPGVRPLTGHNVTNAISEEWSYVKRRGKHPKPTGSPHHAMYTNQENQTARHLNNYMFDTHQEAMDAAHAEYDDDDAWQSMTFFHT